MSETPFLITIDTEGDNLWSRPREITTHNAAYLPRFQRLSERFGFKPVYLTNYEMAMSGSFIEFAQDVVARGTGEIGMHLHAWNSPPLYPLTDDDFYHQPYLIEFPAEIIREKIRTLTGVLEERVDRKMISHRAGRWAFNGSYASALLEEGYRVDCSVTPGIDWRGNRGAPSGNGGTDYSAFPPRPYFLSPTEVTRPATQGLLEVPMTVHSSRLHRRARWLYGVRLLRRAANRVSPGLTWLCPVQPTLRAPLSRHLDAMLAVACAARLERVAHLEFMMHSSELMPGGSPALRTESDIERVYDYLEVLFAEVSAWCRGATLAEFYEQYRHSDDGRDAAEWRGTPEPAPAAATVHGRPDGGAYTPIRSG